MQTTFTGATKSEGLCSRSSVFLVSFSDQVETHLSGDSRELCQREQEQFIQPTWQHCASSNLLPQLTARANRHYRLQ